MNDLFAEYCTVFLFLNVGEFFKSLCKWPRRDPKLSIVPLSILSTVERQNERIWSIHKKGLGMGKEISRERPFLDVYLHAFKGSFWC